MKAIPFGELFEFIRNGMNIKQDKSKNGLPITRIETIAAGSIDAERVGYAGLKPEDCRHWFLKTGDILFSHINSAELVGKCAVYRGRPEQLVHGMNLLCLRPKALALDPNYAQWLIRSSGFRARLWNFINKAVNQASVSIGNLRTIQVSVPPLEEQRRIAAILDKADALRQKRRAAIQNLEALTHSIFFEIFGDPVLNTKGFRKRSLGQLLRLKSGDFLPASQMSELGSYPVYGGNGISGYHDEYMFEDPMIVIGRVGVYCGAIHISKPCSWITDNALYVQEYDPALSFLYLATALRIANLNQYAGQAAQPLISGGRIYPVEILVPPQDLQEEFAAAMRKVDENLLGFQRSSEIVDALFSSLQSAAFSKGVL